MKKMFHAAKATVETPCLSLDDADTLILVDASNMASRASHTFQTSQGLTTSKGKESGHIYGMLRMIDTAYHKLKSGRTAIVIALEGMPAWRYHLLPTYKAHRRPPIQAEDIELAPSPKVEQIGAAMMLPTVKVQAPNGEADDAIGIICHRLRSNQRACILSTDRDLWQLTRRNVTVFLQGFVPVTETVCHQRFGINTAQIPLYKALYGDGGDGIPKVERLPKSLLATLHEAKAVTLADLEMLLVNGEVKAGIADRIRGSDYRDAFAAASIMTDGALVTESWSDLEGFKRILELYEMRSLTHLLSWFGAEEIQTVPAGGLQTADQQFEGL